MLLKPLGEPGAPLTILDWGTSQGNTMNQTAAAEEGGVENPRLISIFPYFAGVPMCYLDYVFALSLH